MNKEEFDVLVNDILKVPMEEPPISAYGSINVNELRQVIEAFNKIPNYDELIKDNCKKDKEIQRLNNIIDDIYKIANEDDNASNIFMKIKDYLDKVKEGKE